MSLAFFDLDGTIVKGQSQILLLLYLARTGAIGKFLFVRICLRYLAYKVGLVSNPGQAMAYAYLNIAKGLSREAMEDIVTDFYDKILRYRLCVTAVARVKKHIESGDEVVLLTNVFEPLAKVVAQRLGINRVIATRMEVVNRAYTGKIKGKIVYGDNKAEVLRRHYKEEQLRNGYAYADHPSDRAFLNMVGTAFLVDAREGRIKPYAQ